MVKKKQEIDVMIEEVRFANQGIAHVDDQEVIIKDTIKGQRVRARVVKKRRKKIQAQLLEILERAPYEIEYPCVHFEKCGGCKYQTMPYEEQLNMKASQVNHLLQEAGVNDYDFLGIEGSPTDYKYRNKMEFTFGDVEKDGPLALGMHQKGKYYEMLSVTECIIADEDFSKALEIVLDYFRELGTSFHHRKTHEGVLRNLVVRKGTKTGDLMINLVTTSQEELDLTNLVDILTQTAFKGNLKSILHTVNDSLADVVQSDETRLLYGQDYITEELLGLKFKISPFSFFQTNSDGAEKLYTIAREFADSTDDKIIFDLYSGTGTIAQMMAPVAKKVIGIEIVEEAVEAAKENANLNGLDNCDFIAGDVFEKVDAIEEKPDIIILDPPRPGIHQKALPKIINFGAPHIVYISCNPKTLARDLAGFQENGYKVTKVKCMDMFPQTPHIETIVNLIKA